MHVGEVYKNTLSGFRTKENAGSLIFDYTHLSFKHQVELTDFGKIMSSAGRALCVGSKFVGTETLIALAAVYQRIGESLNVARSFPSAGVHKDGGIDTDHIISFLHVGAPPNVFDVLLHLSA